MNTLMSYSKQLLQDNNISLPVIIDLFSGCGGLGYGFKSAGFPVESGIDLSPPAANTATYNLHSKFGEDKIHLAGDITKLSGSDFVRNKSSIVIGGPPCQAYSQIGRGKLKSLGEHRMHTNDMRGQLYLDFIRIALDADAEVIVMENVPESTNYGGKNVPEEVCGILESHNYKAKWTILNAADYGVPQTRERMFVIAIKSHLSEEVTFPRPTHKSFAGKTGSYTNRIPKFLSTCNNFVEPPAHIENALDWVTVEDAISDLPSLYTSSTYKYQLLDNKLQLNYSSQPMNEYQHLMRGWTGREMKSVSGHGFRRTLRDFPIFERMLPGNNFIDASRIADEILSEKCKLNGVYSETDHRYEILRKETVPPYDRTKFKDKWKKLRPDLPSHTLVAHLSVDTYSHLHPWEPRGISVREAARLQSFPDDFYFPCKMSDAFKQIGNAVPPLLSYAIAKHLKKIFEK